MSSKVTAGPAPVFFINPVILTEPLVTIGLRQEPPAGFSGGSGAIDRTAERLTALIAELGASVVITGNVVGGFDPRDTMLARGLRAPWAGTLALDQGKPETRDAAITGWLASHGNPPSVVIDRPDSGAIGTLRVTISSGSQLTDAHCREIAEQLGRARKG